MPAGLKASAKNLNELLKNNFHRREHAPGFAQSAQTGRNPVKRLLFTVYH
jgi:hypothetical protein